MKKLIIIPVLSLLIFSACGQTVEINNSDTQTPSVNDNAQTPDKETDTSVPPEQPVLTPEQPVLTPEQAGDNDFLRANGIEIFVASPLSGDTISSPVIVKGKALGNWFFEGVLPVSLEDERGNLLSAAPARALSDWMTEDYVEFEATLSFDLVDNQAATITIKNDNPSGLPENSKEYKVPVKLVPATAMQNETETSALSTINIYFPNTTLDPEMMDCGKVFAVERSIPKVEGIALAALNEMLKGPSESEKTEGYFSSINDGVTVNRLKIEDGTAYADFSVRLGENVGGSCKVGSIRAQIEDTLKQFDSVQNVVISIDGNSEEILQP